MYTSVAKLLLCDTVKLTNMPYTIKKQGNKYKIIRKMDNKVVGTSTSRAKAGASIGYRMSNEPKK